MIISYHLCNLSVSVISLRLPNGQGTVVTPRSQWPSKLGNDRDLPLGKPWENGKTIGKPKGKWWF